MESRKPPRFAVQLPAAFSGENISGEGTVVDLSEVGCGIITENSPAVSTNLTMMIDLYGDDSPLAIELAAVRWSSDGVVGVSFLRIGVAELERLRAFVKTLAVDP